MTVVTQDTRYREVQIFTGGVKHYLDNYAPVVPGLDLARQPSLCNYRPIWPGVWWDAEDTDLVLCKRCEAIRGTEVSDSTS